jgi:hypothetical protein
MNNAIVSAALDSVDARSVRMSDERPDTPSRPDLR